jgi:hypothetical protein
MRRCLLVLSLTVLAACANLPPPVTGPQQGVRASFPPGAVVNVIRVDALDTLPLRSAELIAPDGGSTPASSLDAQANPSARGGQSTLSDPWRSSMLSAGDLDLRPNQLQSVSGNATVRSQTQLLLTVSTADIPLPDPVAYRENWAKYKIRLGFGAAGDRLDIREIAAPEPPSGG